MVLTAISFTNVDFLQNRTSAVLILLEKPDSTEWEIQEHTLIHRTKIQKPPVSSDLVSESISQAWHSQALLALPKHSHFLGSCMSDEVIQNIATPLEGLSSMTFLSHWNGSVPVYLERFAQSSYSFLTPSETTRETLEASHFPP